MAEAGVGATEAERVAARLAEHACRELATPAAWVHGFREAASELVLLAERGLPRELVPEHRRLRADGPFLEARAARLRVPQILRADRAEPGLTGSSAILSGIRAAGLLALPLVAGDRLVGVLTCAAADVRQLAPEAVEEALEVPELFAVGLATAASLDLERRLRAQLDGVRQAALALADATDLATALQTIVEQARRLVGARYAALGIVRAGDPEAPFDPWVQSGMTPAQAAAIGRTPRPVGLLGAVPKEGRSLRLRDLSLDSRYRGLPPHHPEIHSFLGVPIRSHGRPVGNLYLGEKEGADGFDEEDERAAALLAEHAGAAVERFRDLARLKHEVAAGDRARRALAAQSSTARILAESPPVPEAAQRVLQAIGEALGWDWGCLWLVEPGGTVLRCASVWRAEGLSVPQFEAMTRQLTFPAGVGLPGRVWASGRPVWLHDAADDPRFLRLGLAAREGLHGALFVPVTTDGRFLGVIEIMSREVRVPDDELLAMLAGSGAQIGQLIERRRAHDDRERLLAELAAERSWLRAVVERSPVGILLAFGPAGDRVVANRRAEQLLGMRIDPAAGIAQLVGRILDADGMPLALPELPPARALSRGESVSGAELLCRRADVERAILVNAAPIEDAAGSRTGAAMVIEDISSLRELQQLRDEWTSMVAHDLRQPVSVISAAASLISREGAPPAVKLLAERILSGSRRLDRMIADLGDASRLDARRLELLREETDVAALIRACVERAQTGGLAVRVESPAEALPAWLDPGRIEQVVGNLLSNAAKHGKEGGAVEVVVERAGAEARISVLNEGPELSAPELEALFGRFRRGAATERGRVAGIGLGLYISRGLVEAHGGRIWAEPAPGGRIAFRFTLPLGEAGPRPGRESPAGGRESTPAAPAGKDA